MEDWPAFQEVLVYPLGLHGAGLAWLPAPLGGGDAPPAVLEPERPQFGQEWRTSRPGTRPRPPGHGPAPRGISGGLAALPHPRGQFVEPFPYIPMAVTW